MIIFTSLIQYFVKASFVGLQLWVFLDLYKPLTHAFSQFIQSSWKILSGSMSLDVNRLNCHFRSLNRCFTDFKSGLLFGPLKHSQKRFLRPLQHCIGCLLQIVAILTDEPSSQPQVSCILKKFFFKNFSVFGFICPSLISDQSPCSYCWEVPP